MPKHATAHGDDNVRQSALKVDSGRKIPCHHQEAELHQQHAGPGVQPTELRPHPEHSNKKTATHLQNDQCILHGQLVRR